MLWGDGDEMAMAGDVRVGTLLTKEEGHMARRECHGEAAGHASTHADLEAAAGIGEATDMLRTVVAVAKFAVGGE